VGCTLDVSLFILLVDRGRKQFCILLSLVEFRHDVTMEEGGEIDSRGGRGGKDVSEGDKTGREWAS
jgi:hypothetical protein